MKWKPFEFIGTCVTNPFPTVDELSEVIDSALEIKPATFYRWCDVPDEAKQFINALHNDYTFYKSRYRGLVIYFYTWSAIEHFYAHGSDWNALYDGGMCDEYRGRK